MDFAFSDEQQAFAELARKIFAARCSADRLKTLETGGVARFDRALWQELAAAGLLGIAIPEAFGGAGQGFFELASVIEEVGRHTAPVPLIETLVLGALPIAEFGSEAQQQAWLPAVAEGRLILSAALLEPESDPARPDAPPLDDRERVEGGLASAGPQTLRAGGTDRGAGARTGAPRERRGRGLRRRYGRPGSADLAPRHHQRRARGEPRVRGCARDERGTAR